MEGLGSKSLRIHLESTKDVYMYTSLIIDYKVTMSLFYIVYNVQAQRRKGCPSLLALLLFEMIWNYEDKNNEFNKPYQDPH